MRTWLRNRGRVPANRDHAEASSRFFVPGGILPLLGFAANAIVERAIEFYLLWTIAAGQASSVAVSAVYVARFAPPLMMAPAMYAVVHRWPPRRVMVVSQVVKFPVLLLILLVHPADTVGLAVLVLLASASAVTAFGFDVAFQAAIPSFTPQERLAAANSAFQLVRQAGNFLTPVAAGLVLAGFGDPALIIMVIGLSVSAAITLQVSGIRDGQSGSRGHGSRAGPARSSSMGPGRPGRSKVAYVVAAAMAVNVGISATSTILPRYTQTVVGGGPEYFGLLSAFAAGGAAVGAAAFGIRLSLRPLAALAGGGTAAMAIGAAALATGFPVAGALGMGIIGSGAAVTMLAGNVELQRSLRGRELAQSMVTKTTAVRIVVVFGSVAGGIGADLVGVNLALSFVIGLLLVSSALLIAFRGRISEPRIHG